MRNIPNRSRKGINIFSSRYRFTIQRNIASNTCEQLLLHGSCQLLLSTLLSEQEMKMIPLLSSLFLLGRVLFYVG